MSRLDQHVAFVQNKLAFDRFIHALARESIDCHFIGQVVPREQGLLLVDGAHQVPLPIFPQDEITRLFEMGGASRTPHAPHAPGAE